MRLTPMTRRDWLWAVGGLVIAGMLEGLLEPTGEWLASMSPLFEPPPALPTLFDPFQPLMLPPTEFMGEPLRGQWWVAFVYGVSLIINIGGEEIAWRGYLLPKQEVVFGRWAWLLNALLWVLYYIW